MVWEEIAIDYTFFMNLVFAAVAGGLVWLCRRHDRESESRMKHDMKGGGIRPKRVAAMLCLAALCIGLLAFFSAGQ